VCVGGVKIFLLSLIASAVLKGLIFFLYKSGPLFTRVLFSLLDFSLWLNSTLLQQTLTPVHQYTNCLCCFDS
jgi:hypothetical protein